MKINQHSHGKPITGSLKPIENTQFEKNLNEIIQSTKVANLIVLQKCRDTLKEIVALYLQHAARLNGKSIQISEKSKNIFIKSLEDNDNKSISHFANCCIKYFNNEKKIKTSLNLSIPECGSLNVDKAFQQASKNAQKIVKSKINKIISKMENNSWDNIPEELLYEYKGIETAIISVCSFITTLVNGKLPCQISTDLYKKAIQQDSKVQDIYQLSTELDIYKLKKCSRATYTSVNQECATLIFCKTKKSIFLK